MKIVQFSRGGGKTTMLINEMLKNEEAFLLVSSFNEMQDIEKKHPKLAGRVKPHAYLMDAISHRMDIPQEVYVDNLDNLLYMLGLKNIKLATYTEIKEE